MSTKTQIVSWLEERPHKFWILGDISLFFEKSNNAIQHRKKQDR